MTNKLEQHLEENLPRPLLLDVARCTGGESISWTPEPLCPRRKTCARFVSRKQWDKQLSAGAREHVVVFMAVEDCGDYIGVDPARPQ